jgi:hypothetical protein
MRLFLSKYYIDKVYQLLARGRWFSPGTAASSTTKTGRYDIAEILLKVALKHQKSNQSLIYTCSTLKEKVSLVFVSCLNITFFFYGI